MAQKKKKKPGAQRHKQQQKKQQRRSARIQKRQRVPRPPTAPAPLLDRTLLDDMLPLFPRVDGAVELPTETTESILQIAWETADLADEPEFDEIAISPLEVVPAYAEAAQAIERKHGRLEQMDEEEREEHIFDALEQVAQQVLTPDLRDELGDALTALRQRLREEDDEEELARAATVQFFLQSDKTGQIAATLGLVQALIRRSLEAGFALAEAIEELPEEEQTDTPPTAQELRERLASSGIAQKLTSTIGKIPGMQRFLENQVDKAWEEGVKAGFTGQLPFVVYTPDEVEAATAIAADVLGTDQLAGIDIDDPPFVKGMAALIPRLTDYVHQLFTPTRLQQLRQQLDDLTSDRTHGASQWAPFLLMLRDEVAEEDGVDGALRFLIAALLGQVLPALGLSQSENTEP